VKPNYLVVQIIQNMYNNTHRGTKHFSPQKQQDKQCAYNVPLRHARATVVAAKIGMSITQPECVFVALDIQHAMRYTVSCGLP
jgi:hypothetical protein